MTYVISNYLDRHTAFAARSRAECLEDPRWAKRSRLTPPRQIEGSSCSYDFCGQRQMDKETLDFLTQIAPYFDEYKLAEIALNRYKIGDYLGKHRDFDYYRKNVVIALQDGEDGLTIDESEEFVKDKLGQGVCIDGIGPVHSVAPVKEIRYTLIYLYE